MFGIDKDDIVAGVAFIIFAATFIGGIYIIATGG